YRTGPAWTGTISHPLVVLAGLALGGAALWPRARRRALDGPSALLALALVLLLRCLLDTWDTGYYMLPFLIALLAPETRRTPTEHQLPALAAAATALTWISFHWLPQHASADVQSALYVAWAAPLALWLGVCLRRDGAQLLPRTRPRNSADGQETTVSS